MKLYFENLTQENEIKARYKELAKKNHPDLGGSLEVMQEINNQYEQVLKSSYQEEGKSITEIDELFKKDINLRNKMNMILALEGLEVEICGSWVWVTGNTLAHKNKLKESKFLWARKKNAWYWRKAESKSYNRKTYSLEEIRSRHGSTTLKNKINQMLA